MSERRFQLLFDEINTIARNLRLLEGALVPSVDDIQAFEEKYRRQLSQRHGFITPPHFNLAKKIPIGDIFVPPRLTQDMRRDDKQTRELTYTELIATFYRNVILGNPGGGKSTLAGKLCYDLAHDYRKRPLAARQATPILVVLRDYGTMKKEQHCSIVQFMETIANSNYQVAPPPKCFEYMLLNGRAVVVFDGLDELLDTSHRREITEDIEAFCNLYPSTPILVTSREVGYEQAPLDKKKFVSFRLAPFDEAQVSLYVREWFNADSDLTIPSRQQKATTFLQESKIVSDLRSNPLMLGLMCSIYRGENYIPRNRPDVYEKCALMLFEKWDKSRGVIVSLPFEAHINPAMKFLAHWIYSDDRLQGGVAEPQLVSRAADYLCTWRYEDRIEAEKAARDFIDFCTGRAWVFTDTGTTKEGDRLYQFTHRTFLEYFTAAHLVRTHGTPQELGAALTARLMKREWDVVAQLAYQLQNKQVEGAGDKLLTDLVDNAKKQAGNASRNLLSFASRCLEFLVPSPKTVREIANTCISETFSRIGDASNPTETMGNLLQATEENLAPISDCIEKRLIAGIEEPEEAKSVAAITLAGRLAWTVSQTSAGFGNRSDIHIRWNPVSRKVVDACAARIGELAPQSFEVASIGFEHEIVSLAQIIEWYGAEGLFRDFVYLIFPNIFMVSIAYKYVMSAIGGEGADLADGQGAYYNEIVMCGQYLLKAPRPWWKTKGRTPYCGHEEAFHPVASRVKPGSKMPTDVLFGCFALLIGLLAGIKEESDIRQVLPSIRSSSLPFFDQLRWVFLAHFDRSLQPRAEEEIFRSGFSTQQTEFVEAWAKGDLVVGEMRNAA
ncbi:MAG: NACHT domain-containing protein [Candidatus Acidiferrales bacterium]